MRRWWLGFGVAAVLVAGAACGGDKAAPQAVEPEAPASGASARTGDASAPESERLVSARAVLSRAAQKQQEADSFRGEFAIGMAMGSEQFTIDGEMAFSAPDSMHIVMDLMGERMQMIMRLPDVWVEIPGEGWKTLSFDDLGVDFEQFREYFENRGLLDMQEMAAALGDVEQLEDEAIDGETYQHFRGEPGLSRLSDAIPSSTIDPEFLEQALDSVEDTIFEFWVDPDTQLIRRFAMDMTMDFLGTGEMQMDMTMDFLEYNTEVDIPDPPAGAERLNPLE